MKNTSAYFLNTSRRKVPVGIDDPFFYDSGYIPKMGFGGDLFKSSILGGGSGSPVASLGTMGAGLVNTVDGMDGKTSMGGSIASNALKFGAMGATIGGPWGAAIGGVIGAGVGFFSKKSEDKEKRRMEREAREQQAQQMNQMNEMNSQAVLSTYPTKGVFTQGFYKRGGAVKPQYQVEDGEILYASEAAPPVTDKFGTTTRIAPNTFKFKGATHDHASGGIGVRGGNAPYTDMYGQPHHTGFVLSNALKTDSRKYLKNI